MFLSRQRWDLASTPAENFPLLLHYHPLVIYRYQIIKQADVVLAMFLLGDQFTAEQRKRNYDYYEPLTTGDSSLSASVHAIMAAETGEEEAALDYFRYALMIDLADVAGDVSDGVHIACAASTWMTLAYGFAGMQDFHGKLSFDPRLPTGWTRLSLPLRFHDRQLRVDLTHEGETYSLVEGEPVELTIRGRRHVLAPGCPVVIPTTAHRVGTAAS